MIALSAAPSIEDLSDGTRFLIFVCIALLGLLLALFVRWRSDTKHYEEKLHDRTEICAKAINTAEHMLDRVDEEVERLLTPSPVEAEIDITSRKHNVICVIDSSIQDELVEYITILKKTVGASIKMKRILQMFIFIPVSFDKPMATVWRNKYSKDETAKVAALNGIIFNTGSVESVFEVKRYAISYAVPSDERVIGDISTYCAYDEGADKAFVKWDAVLPSDVCIFYDIDTLIQFFVSLHNNQHHLYRVHGAMYVSRANSEPPPHPGLRITFDPEWLAERNSRLNSPMEQDK